MKIQTGKADKYATVIVDKNRYSLPSRYSGYPVKVQLMVDRVDHYFSGKKVASHARLLNNNKWSPFLEGGIQDEDKKSGIPYVRWPDSILEKKILLNSVEQISGSKNSEGPKEEETTAEEKGFREKFLAKHSSTDGHFVRSKAEILIDNWLYMAEIVHAYERKIPVEVDVYCDFYIPTGKVYIEYSGYDDNPRYLKRKKAKKEIYEKYGINLIELRDKHVQNPDDILPRLLLKHGIQAY